MSSNVEFFTHLAERALTTDDLSLRSNIFDQMSNLPLQNKVTLFRHTERSTYDGLFDNYKSSILNKLSKNGSELPILRQKSIQNNQRNADLIGISGNDVTNIELKWGQETNSNIGVSSFLEVFSSLPESILDYFSLENRTKRKQLMLDNTNNFDLSTIYNENSVAYTKFARLFNQTYSKSKVSSDNIEVISEIINGSGSFKNSSSASYLKVIISPKGTEFQDPYTLSEQCNVSASFSKDRLTIFCVFDKTIVKLIMNCKNNIHVRNSDIIIPSKSMLGSISFNLWARRK